MRSPISPICFRGYGVVLLAAALGGCGGSAPVKGPASEQVIFTSGTDCAASGKIKAEQCSQALETALAQHLARSPIYKSLALCEATEGVEKCERMDAKAYRPRLEAVVASVAAAADAAATGAPLIGTPLYPTMAGEPGFRTLDKTLILVDGDLMVFSPQAVAAVELNAPKKQ